MGERESFYKKLYLQGNLWLRKASPEWLFFFGVYEFKMDISVFLFWIRKCVFLCGLSHWIPKWNWSSWPLCSPTLPTPAPRDTRRESKEKWLEVELQEGLFLILIEEKPIKCSYLLLLTKYPLRMDLLQRIPSAGLLYHLLVFTLFLPLGPE